MRGGDTTALRDYNERLVIDSIRRNGPLSQAEIGRATGLSGQAASMIVKRLLADEMVMKGEKVRGRIGQPSTPIALNPDGAYALGVKLGRRSVEAVLVNMVGQAVEQRTVEHDFPVPDRTLETATSLAKDLLGVVPKRRRKRVVGAGIAMPGDLPVWASELGIDPERLEGWRDRDVAGEIGAATGLQTTVFNDATAACAAEVISGSAIDQSTALYLYLGTFIGAGVVIDGKLYMGAQSNAGAFGSMPTCRKGDGSASAQLLTAVSIITLQQLLVDAGLDRRAAMMADENPAVDTVFDAWARRMCKDVARATVSALAVIDFDLIVVDGLLSPARRARLTERLKREHGRFDLRGLTNPDFRPGTIGPAARALGAALLPLRERFTPDPNLLVNTRSG